VWSRKIIGWEVFAQESADHAASLIQRAVWAEDCLVSAQEQGLSQQFCAAGH
jgi:hypothetical protein